MANIGIEDIAIYSIIKCFYFMLTSCSPVQNLSDPSLPYTGRIFAVGRLNSSTIKDTSKDDGACSSVFGADCLSEIRDSIQHAASSHSGTPADSADSFECTKIFNTLTFGTTNGSKCGPSLFTETFAT